MKLNKYNSFSLGLTLSELIVESRLIYTSDFRKIIHTLKYNNDRSVSKVAKFINYLANKDIDKVIQNYIDIASDNDKISFIPDNKIKLSKGIKLTDNNGILNSSNIIELLKVSKNNLIVSISISSYGDEVECIYYTDNLQNKEKISLNNDWKIIEDYEGDKFGYNSYIFTLLENIEYPEYKVISYNTKYNEINNINTLVQDYSELDNIKKSNIKIGRFINKLLELYFKTNTSLIIDYNEYTKNDFSLADIEKFVNAYIAEVQFQKNIFNSFEIVEGEDIRYWYNTENYENNNGQLGNSCMKYSYCSEYFDIYVENPDVCKLLILKSPDNKLIGRALLWIDTNGGKWIDRIYTNKDSYTPIFKKWASKNNYSNIYESYPSVSIQVKSGDYNHYPYMDSLCYYKKYEGLLYTTDDGIDYPLCILQNTNGTCINRG